MPHRDDFKTILYMTNVLFVLIYLLDIDFVAQATGGFAPPTSLITDPEDSHCFVFINYNNGFVIDVQASRGYASRHFFATETQRAQKRSTADARR